MPENESSTAKMAQPERSLEERVNEVVTYHKPSEEQVAQITDIRVAAANFITVIVRSCPPSPDRSAAIRKVREAMMTANAAIVVPQFTF